MTTTRTSAKKKAKELVKLLRLEHPDYAYLKSVFRELRQELGVEVPRTPQAASRYSDRRGGTGLLSTGLAMPEIR